MRKIILLLIVVVLLSGCTSKTKQIQEYSNQAESLVANEKYDDAISIYNKILELKDDKVYKDKITEVENMKYEKQAEGYEKEARFDDAIALYTKILQSKEDKKFRDKINDLKEEKEAVEITKKVLKELTQVNSNISSARIEADIKSLLDPLNSLIADFEKIDTTKGTPIAKYVAEFKKQFSYGKLTGTLNSELTKNAKEGDEKTDLTLDLLVGDLSLTKTNSMILDFRKDNIKSFTEDLISIDLPSQYK